MKIANSKLIPKSIKLDTKEKYTRLFSTKNDDTLSFRSGHVILKENESIGEHNAGDSEEILIILEGRGELLINGREKLNFEKDTALYIPPNTVHDVRNKGAGPLKYVFIASQILPRGKSRPTCLPVREGRGERANE